MPLGHSLGTLTPYFLLLKKREALRIVSTSIKIFLSCVSDCSLVDIGFSGPNYTWFRGLICECLDRTLCNSEWKINFLDTTIQHIPRTKSDHRPILLRTDGSYAPRCPRPFRFQAVWLTHPGFSSVIKASWLNDDNWFSASKKFTDAIVDWNWETFGNIFKRKKSLLNQIEKVETILGIQQSAKLLEVYANLRKTYEDTALQ